MKGAFMNRRYANVVFVGCVAFVIFIVWQGEKQSKVRDYQVFEKNVEAFKTAAEDAKVKDQKARYAYEVDMKEALSNLKQRSAKNEATKAKVLSKNTLLVQMESRLAALEASGKKDSPEAQNLRLGLERLGGR